MSEVQIPSTKLNTYLRDPAGGKSISEAEEYIQPTLDMIEFLYPTETGVAQFVTEAGSEVAIPLQAGKGVYKLEFCIAGFITANLASENSLELNTAIGSNDILTLLNVSLAAAQIYNVAPQSFVMYFNVTSDAGEGLLLAFNTSSAPTKVELEVNYHITRVQ